MFAGVGGYEYPGKDYSNAAHFYMEDMCVRCHMPELGSSDPGFLYIGNHTWNMHDDGGTPDDPSDDLFNTAGCEPCHGPVEDFNINGIQDRVQALTDKLAGLLPVDEVAVTEAQTRAAFNWWFVRNDGTKGVHNHTYAEQLLEDSIESLGGQVAAEAGQVRVLEGGVARGGLIVSAAPAGKLVLLP